MKKWIFIVSAILVPYNRAYAATIKTGKEKRNEG